MTRLTDKFSHDLAEVQLPLGILRSGLLSPSLENGGIKLTHFVLLDDVTACGSKIPV